jgi:hypothetical protein
METVTVFERRSERAGIVSMRVGPAERRELERLARQAGALRHADMPRHLGVTRRAREAVRSLNVQGAVA